MRQQLGMMRSLLVCLLLQSSSILHAQLDSTWTVYVDGKPALVDDDGVFEVWNISSPDEHGPGGPGTAPDFLSDRKFRLYGVGEIGGVQKYVISTFFQVSSLEPFSIDSSSLTFLDTPPIIPVEMVGALGSTVLTFPSEQTQFSQQGVLLDGITTIPLTGGGTTYLTSNPSVAMIDDQGLVTAIEDGKAILTALNSGMTLSVELEVALDPDTTAVGFVLEPDGTPVPGASVSILGQIGQSAVTATDGSFEIQGVFSELGPVSVHAEAQLGGDLVRGGVGGGEPLPDMLTDVGIVYLDNEVVPPRAFYVLNDGPTVSVSAFSVLSDGSIGAEFAGSPVSTGGEPGSGFFTDNTMALSGDESYLFVSHGGSQNIVTLQVNGDGSLSTTATTPFVTGIGDVHMESFGGRLYFHDDLVAGVRELFVCDIQADGSLVEASYSPIVINSPPLPDGAIRDFYITNDGLRAFVAFTGNGFVAPFEPGLEAFHVQPDGSFTSDFVLLMDQGGFQNTPDGFGSDRADRFLYYYGTGPGLTVHELDSFEEVGSFVDGSTRLAHSELIGYTRRGPWFLELGTSLFATDGSFHPTVADPLVTAIPFDNGLGETAVSRGWDPLYVAYWDLFPTIGSKVTVHAFDVALDGSLTLGSSTDLSFSSPDFSTVRPTLFLH